MLHSYLIDFTPYVITNYISILGVVRVEPVPEVLMIPNLVA